MKTCGKPYHGTLGIVVNCSEETPCRDCLLIEVGRLEYMVQSLQGEQAARSAPVAVDVPEPTDADWTMIKDQAESAGLEYPDGFYDGMAYARRKFGCAENSAMAGARAICSTKATMAPMTSTKLFFSAIG